MAQEKHRLTKRTGFKKDSPIRSAARKAKSAVKTAAGSALAGVTGGLSIKLGDAINDQKVADSLGMKKERVTRYRPKTKKEEAATARKKNRPSVGRKVKDYVMPVAARKRKAAKAK